MAELVQKHAEKKQDHENKTVPRRCGTARGVARSKNPGEKQQEGDMNADDGARYLADIQ